jgi:tetratricopeptide (TPR) repeat protein
MPKWWPFQKDSTQASNTQAAEDAAFKTAESTLRAQIEQQQAEGVSAQATIYFIETQSQALEKEAQTAVAKGKLRAFDLLYSELRPRLLENLSNGKALEMAGQIEAACQHYEQALKDQVSTRFPYEHLRVIYRREGKLKDALRVCQAALANPFLKEVDLAHFRSWAEKIQAQLTPN